MTVHPIPDRSNQPDPPAGLSLEAQGLWVDVVREYDLDPTELRTLEAAVKAYDRWQEAEAIIEAEGLVYLDRFDQPKPHPAEKIAKDSRSQYLAAVRVLNLEGAADPVYSHRARRGR